MKLPLTNLKITPIIALSVGALAVSPAYFLHRYPLTIPPASEPERAAVFVLDNTPTTVTLVLETAQIRQSWRARSLSQADFSSGWVNTLEQEVGSFATVDVGSLSASSLAEVSLLVVSSSALRDVDYEMIGEFVQSGGYVLLEAPEENVLSKLGLSIEVKVSADSAVAGASLTAGWSESSAERIPVFSATRKYYSLSGAELLHSAGSVCSFVQKGAGGVFLSGWSFARSITLIQQGRPNEDLSVTNRYKHSGQADKLESNDLIASEVFVDTPIPWADVLEKTLFNFIAETMWLPRWSASPAGYDGVMLMTHDEEGLGDPAIWMNRYESSRGFTSTTFAMFSDNLTAGGVETIGKLGGEIGLHWNRFDRSDKGAYKLLGLGKWRPLQRKLTLAEQKEWLQTLGVATEHNRNHYFLWDDDYARTFRILNAHGFTMDLSYGPDLSNKGYIFGCAFPFRPLDNNGAAFTLLETPVSWTEDFLGADSAYLWQMMKTNSKHLHGVLVPLYHNNTFAWRPNYDTYLSWLRTYDLALQTNHNLLRVSELEEFLRQRQTGIINWTEKAGQMIIHCQTTDDLAMLVPSASVGRPLASPAWGVVIDQTMSLATSYWRIALPAGEHTLVFDRLEGALE